VKQKSRPARVGSSVVTGELLARRPTDKLLKQTGGEDRPVQYNSEERLLAAGGDIGATPFKSKKEMRAG